MGRLWVIFGLLALALTVMNPYIGLFGLFVVISVFIHFCIAVNVKSIANIAAFSKLEGDERYTLSLGKRLRSLLNSWCVISIFLFGVCTFVSVVMWELATGYFSGVDVVGNVAPFSLFREDIEFPVSTAFLVLSILFNLMTIICIFFRRKEVLRKMDDMESIPMSERKDHITYTVKMTYFLPLLAAAMIFGVLNMYIGWFSPIIHLMYLLFLMITKITISAKNKMAKTSTPLAINARYGLSVMMPGKSWNNLLLAVVWILTSLVLLLQVILGIVSQLEVFRILDIGMDYLFLALSAASNICIAIILSKSIRSIK